MKTAKTMSKKAEQLSKALNRVWKLADEIEEWAEQNGVDGADFAYRQKLDNPYEFDLEALLDEIREIGEQS